MGGGGFGRIFVWTAIGLVCLVLLPFVLFTALLGASSAASCGGRSSAAIPAGAKGLPPQFVPIYAAAAQKYQLGPRGFGILAAIHHIESDFGQNMGPSSAGAIGQMQFMPGTWVAYGQDGNGDGKEDPYNPWDAIFGAANYLHASGLNPRASEGQVRNAILAYNHADWYVEEVLAQAAQYGAGGGGPGSTGGELPLITDGGAGVCGPSATGPANMNQVETLYQPRTYRMLPQSVMAPGHSPEPVDARIYDDALFVIATYHLRVSAAREAGHLSHGNGLSLDLIPAGGRSWEESTERFARDIGWRPGCDDACSPPVISAPGWVRWIGYNGASGHGDPAHCSGSCGAHLHVSWLGSSGAQAALVPPDTWVKVFPVGSAPAPTSPAPAAPKAKKGKKQ
jgi:hypothetical protein